MYTCRNAHRRTPYFLRLEHVRRLIRRIDVHPAWHVISRQTPSPANIRKKKRDSISLTHVRKLQDLINLVDTLVNRAVPNAASLFTLHLIAREHFIPLATTVVAILARIFALERPLLRNLQGALTEARIIAPTPPVPSPTSTIVNSSFIKSVKSNSLNPIATHDDEDIGQLVSSCNIASVSPRIVKSSRNKRSKRFFSVLTDETDEKTVTPISTSAGKPFSLDETTTPATLYDAIALENPNVAALAKAQVIDYRQQCGNVSLPVVKNMTVENAELQSGDKTTKTKKGLDIKDDNDDDNDDDIDDIFAALSD